MKINNNMITIDPHREIGSSDNLESKLSPGSRINRQVKDTVELSTSGKNRSKKVSIPTRKINTAGLVITDLKISSENSHGAVTTVDTSVVTVSNDKAALGASENRLGHNTRSIDNPPKGLV